MREDVKQKFMQAVEHNVDSYYELAVGLSKEMRGNRRLDIILQVIKSMEALFKQIAPLMPEVEAGDYRLEVEVIDPRRNAAKNSNTDS